MQKYNDKQFIEVRGYLPKYQMILSEIQSGQLKPGDRLPTEIALAEKYGVSETILREASPA